MKTLLLTLLLIIPLATPALAQDTPFVVPDTYRVTVIETYPHDSQAFTQGLLWEGGTLYESTGRNGQSTLRSVDLESGGALNLVDVPAEYFAEGLALVDDTFIQLTWQSGVAFTYDRDFVQGESFTYTGEGWGLCYDGQWLYMSDGTPYLSLRDPASFELIAQMLVTIQGQPVNSSLLNELECVGDTVYANLWGTDFIVGIRKQDGQVTSIIDASGLLTEEETAALAQGATLNGIAYNPERETVYLTGKLWPKLFEVVFTPVE
jgi:glutaminyl-peptide cyclotransferase